MSIEQLANGGADDGIAIQGEAAPVESQTTVETSGGDDVESKARLHGWVPREEFKGDPEKWRPADEFVKRGEELLPIALERTRAAERKLADMEARIAQREREYTDTVGRLERMSTKALERQREQLMANYSAAMRQAVELGDVQRFDQLQRDQYTAVQQFDTQVREAVAPPQQQQNGPRPLPPEEQALVSSWVRENAWYERDPAMKALAEAHHVALNNQFPGISLQENLKQVAAEVRRRFPDKFGPTNHKIVAPMVESGGGGMPGAGAGRRTKSAADLPADAKAAAERFVKQGIYKNVNEYAADYWADN